MLDNLLNKRATIYTKSRGSANSFGEKSTTLSSSVTNLAVAVQPNKEDFRFDLKGNTYVATNEAYCDFREDIYPGDYLDVDNVRYLILSVENDGGRDHHLKMWLSRVT